ncbi:pilus assembly protein [Roseovarius spongiae]|uniref:Pilus assembly protein n=1 Tax=Roseovarius spongiae TaxID=2320272 RepID=A0A3A8B4F0_9RHOB|nr:pilus assembly protein [Roseovarius spongiae]RKF16531.1 pilus assembly protein [Roseovarius spongiae]
MFTLPFTQWLKRFRSDEAGTVTVEAVICLPLLFWAIMASFEFFELHRYNSARDKATYTIADMISREMQSVSPSYLDNAKTVFDTIADDNGENEIRVSVIKYDADADRFTVVWSQTRGQGPLEPLTTQQMQDAHGSLPIMGDGEEVIVMESRSIYPPLFDVGIGGNTAIETRVLTSPRFAPQIVWDDS